MNKEKLDKLNEFATSLGMKLYRVDYGFEKNGKEFIHLAYCFNELSEKYLKFINQ